MGTSMEDTYKKLLQIVAPFVANLGDVFELANDHKLAGQCRNVAGQIENVVKMGDAITAARNARQDA